jgi:ketosteroid isomerase-like protein
MIEHPGIERLYQSWSDAFARKDIDAIFGLLTDDYTLWMPGAPPVDRDALRPRLTAALASYDLAPRFECLDRIVSGDFACDIGWDVQDVRPHAAADVPAIAQRQRVCLVLRRGSDSVWRFARGVSQPAPETAGTA